MAAGDDVGCDPSRRTDMSRAADGLLDRLLAHTAGKLDDDVASSLLETTSPPARPEGASAAAPHAPPCRMDPLVLALIINNLAVGR